MPGKQWVEQYVAHFRERSPAAPGIYHETVALHSLSSAVGPTLYFDDGPRTVKPNIWGLLVGPSSLAKKSTALNFGREMLYSTCKELQMSDAGSVEGLLAELAEKSANGVCHIWSNQDEFGRVLSGMKKKDYQVDMKDVLMQLYDGLPLTRRNVKMSWRIDPVYMTLISGCTLTRLSQLLTTDDLEDGFLARFLLAYGEPSDDYVPHSVPQPHWGTARRWLETELSAVRTAYASGQYETACTWHPDAKTIYEQWCADLSSQVRRNWFPGPASSRLEDTFIKLCMLHDLSDKMAYLGKDHEISFETADKVANLISPYVESARMLYGKLGADPEIEHVFRIITSRGDQGISYSELLRVSKRNIRKVAGAIETLEGSERIRREDIRDGASGRPKAHFYKV